MKKLTILLIISIVFPFIIRSQDTIKVYEKNITDSMFLLNEVKIMSVYRIDDKVPITQKTLKKKEINELDKIKDLPQLLSRTPSVTTYSENGLYQGYSYIRLRGVDQTRINMTLNGVPLNEPEDQGAYFSNYPDFITSMSSIQIQRGVGTSSNGTSSYIGSINFESLKLSQKPFYKLHTDFGSYKTQRISIESQKELDIHFPIYVRFSDISTNGYKYHSGNHSKSMFFSTGYYNRKDMFKMVAFIGQQTNQMSWLGSPLDSISKDRRYNTHYGDEYDLFTQTHIQAHLIHSIDNRSTITTTLYYNYLNGNYDFDLNSFLLLPENTLDSSFYNYWMQSNFCGVSSTYSFKSNNLRLYTGFHANMYRREHIGSETKMGKLYDNIGYKNEMSLFFKILYDINIFTLFGDIQYRYTNFDYTDGIPFELMEWKFINPKIGMNINFNTNNRLYYSLGKTSREPTRTDIFMGEDNLWSIDAFANIKPESVIDNELGYIYNNKNLYLCTNLYYMDFSNEIVLNGQYGSNSLPLHSNVAYSTRYGLEFDFNYQISNYIKISNSSSYSKNKIQEDNNSTTHILSPSLIVNQSIYYTNKNTDLYASFRYQGKSYIDYENLYTIDKFYTFDVGTKYKIGLFDLGIGINNILNEKYFAYGHMNYDGTIPLYQVGVPRNFNISINITL